MRRDDIIGDVIAMLSTGRNSHLQTIKTLCDVVCGVRARTHIETRKKSRKKEKSQWWVESGQQQLISSQSAAEKERLRGKFGVRLLSGSAHLAFEWCHTSLVYDSTS